MPLDAVGQAQRDLVLGQRRQDSPEEFERVVTGLEQTGALHYRAETLRVTVFHNHPPHAPPAAEECATRRRAALRVLACVCRACGGDWGFGRAREPGGGTRMSATLPRAGATAYGRVDVGGGNG
ncbi:hypothetical protein ACIPJS_20935 [Streptomyces sp. NPDC086783]|uniref:hypothetical protein n=1 Tax=Streptomyces sp. NPDC086783 TaxID=3365758 RepID=UPI00381949E8